MPKANPKPYEWDYAGACDPAVSRYGHTTFSVGVFQWLPKKSRKGLKRGTVKYRVRGNTDKPQAVYDKAQAACDRLNRLQTERQMTEPKVYLCGCTETQPCADHAPKEDGDEQRCHA